MNVGQIIVPNSKGQVVIPWRIRKQLGIEPMTPLKISVSGSGVYMQPANLVAKGGSADELFADILKRTAGTWGLANLEDRKREAKIRKIEMAASRKRKNAW